MHQVIIRLSLYHFFEGMNWRRSRNMVTGFAVLSVVHVFSTFGGLGREATIFYSHLADLLSKKTLHYNTLFNAVFHLSRAVGLSDLCIAPLSLCAWQLDSSV